MSHFSQKGFAGIAILIVILISLVVAGMFYFGRVGTQKSINAPTYTQNQVNKTAQSGTGSDKFGLCDGFGNRQNDDIQADIQDTKALGFLWGRPLGDVFSQETIEGTGTFDFSVPDKVVNEMENAGIKIFGTLFPTGNPKIPDTIDTQSFARYVKATVSRYKEKITYWQVGIEPFCQTRSETCYKNFFELTKTAYQAAKRLTLQ